MIEAVLERKIPENTHAGDRRSRVEVLDTKGARHHVLVDQLQDVFEDKSMRMMTSGLPVLFGRHSDPQLGVIVLDGFDQPQDRCALTNAIGSPCGHQLAPLLQKIAAPISGFGLVLDRVGQRSLCQLT